MVHTENGQEGKNEEVIPRRSDLNIMPSGIRLVYFHRNKQERTRFKPSTKNKHIDKSDFNKLLSEKERKEIEKIVSSKFIKKIQRMYAITTRGRLGRSISF